MNIFHWNILTVFCLSVAFSAFIIPRILKISFRKKLFDLPDERKIHHEAVPRLGGLAFNIVIIFAMILVIGMNLVSGRLDLVENIKTNICELLFEFCGMMLLYLVGFMDDMVGVRYRKKFVVQIIAAALLIVGGLWINDLYGLFWIHALPFVFGLLLTLLVVTFITNAINLIDGVDGLASGLCMVLFLIYGISFFAYGEPIYAMISFSGLGVLLPFFYYNVFGRAADKKKIFMGDTGSLTLGYIISFLCIKQMGLTVHVEPGTVNPMVVAFSPLLVPCLDVIRVFLHRIRYHHNPFLPDKNHIHHKLMASGLSQQTTMMTILLCSVLFSAGNAVLSRFWNPTWILLLDIAFWTAFNMILTYFIKRKI